MNDTSKPGLKNFPIAFFSILMGLGGFATALRKGEEIFSLPSGGSRLVFILAGILFVLLSSLYLIKIVHHREAVMQELRHPVTLSFFSTLPITILLLSIGAYPEFPLLSKWFWGVGAAGQLGMTLYVLTTWIHQTHFQIEHSHPSWFIPVVGNIIVPVVGVEHAPLEISWFYFSFGLFFWIILQTIALNRIFFHQPMAEKLIPTLFIMVAPPALGFISYLKITGELTQFAQLLYYIGGFITLLLLVQFRTFSRVKFFLSSWVYSFPAAAITIATLVMYDKTQVIFFRQAGLALLMLLGLLMLWLVVSTVNAIRHHGFCLPE
tara:strand:+ start:2873 stop:3835 length:963 start_codon:yes stop_codon:yes gene_type:complete